MEGQKGYLELKSRFAAKKKDTHVILRIKIVTGLWQIIFNKNLFILVWVEIIYG